MKKEEIQTVWHQDHEVLWEEVTMDNQMSVSGLTQVLLQAAVIHSEHLGYGFSNTSKASISWVLFKFYLEIIRMPAWKEKIHLSTWPHKTKAITAIREFEVVDSQGNTICTASSEWSIIHLKTRRPQRLDSIEGLGERVSDRSVFTHAVERINPKTVFEELFQIKVRYTDMDLNGHANAGKYFDWLSDAVYEIYQSNDIAFVQFNYHHECYLGDHISIQIAKDQPGLIRGFNLDQQQPAFVARVEIRK